MQFRFVPNDKGNPVGKLADGALHFNDGPLAGLKLEGFGVWQRPDGTRRVTFPARQYSINGERRSYALLRPTIDPRALDALTTVVLDAFTAYEQEPAVRS